jgi:hypothetical protein
MTDVFVSVPWVSERVDALSAAACIELFADYGSNIAPATIPEIRDELLSGVIGCIGSGLRATCLLAATETLLRKSCPCTCQPRDWVGEMANQLIGRLKMKLLEVGVDVTLTTPLAFSGVQLTPSPRGTVRPSSFACEAGVVMVWVEVDAIENFAFGPPQPTAATGDMILF